MPLDDRARKVLRTLLAMLAVIVLVAGCSSDKGTTKGSGTATSSTTAKDRASAKLTDQVAKDPCSLLRRADLSKVTGIEFDKAEPGSNFCIYTSTLGLAAITLHFTSLAGADPKAAITQTTRSCDPGTLVRLDFPGAQGGYRCTVKGVASVGVTGEDVFAVLLGATLRTDVPTSRILDDLATILEHAVSGQT